MNINPVTNTIETQLRLQSPLATNQLGANSGTGFHRMLDDNPQDKQELDAVREHEEAGYKAAQQLIATAFIQPMLQKMRDSPFKTDMFHGGSTENIFQSQMDTTLADRMVQSARDGEKLESPKMPIVDAVYKQLLKQQTTLAMG